MATTWTFADRKLTVLGIQGGCEYALDQHGTMYYRFTDHKPPHSPEKRESWKYVANTYRLVKPKA